MGSEERVREYGSRAWGRNMRREYRSWHVTEVHLNLREALCYVSCAEQYRPAARSGFALDCSVVATLLNPKVPTNHTYIYSYSIQGCGTI